MRARCGGVASLREPPRVAEPGSSISLRPHPGGHARARSSALAAALGLRWCPQACCVPPHPVCVLPAAHAAKVGPRRTRTTDPADPQHEEGVLAGGTPAARASRGWLCLYTDGRDVLRSRRRLRKLRQKRLRCIVGAAPGAVGCASSFTVSLHQPHRAGRRVVRHALSTCIMSGPSAHKTGRVFSVLLTDFRRHGSPGLFPPSIPFPRRA